MTKGPTLENYLSSWAQQDVCRRELVAIVRALANAGIELGQIISRYDLDDVADENTDGSIRKPLDLLSHHVFSRALSGLPVLFLASEERDDLLAIDPQASLGVAIDPIDGSSNIETNMSIGTIFSILESTAEKLFDQPLGELQKAAGFLFYGPQTRLILCLGEGTHVFLLDHSGGQFYLAGENLSIPPGQREFAINTSNYRFWDDSVRHFIDDCIAGKDGYLNEDFNMRWNAALVAEAFRILVRGGVFLYPGDSRPAYANGRLRLLYEALPLAMIVEQAGGQASDGSQRILEMSLTRLHERVPLIFGSADRVREVIEYISGEAVETTRFPLFENRSLFRN